MHDKSKSSVGPSEALAKEIVKKISKKKKSIFIKK
jgi:hypothetical protein